MIALTPAEGMTYVIVCRLWRLWRAPALLADIARYEKDKVETVRSKLKYIAKKGWIEVGGVRRSKGRGWVPTHQARAMDRLDEVMALIERVAVCEFEDDVFANRKIAQRLLGETGWSEANPSDPKGS